MNTISENYDYIPISPEMILQLHKDMYKFRDYDIGGKFKVADNIIEGDDEQEKKKVLFRSPLANETPKAIERLCDGFNEAIRTELIDPLLLIPVFILYFLCIHPFEEGNGRMSRLLFLLMLYRADYVIGRYISVEQLIKETEASYIESFQLSSIGWHKEENNYAPFVQYMLGVVIVAYRDFSDRVQKVLTDGLSKTERVAKLIQNTYVEVTKSQIMEKCPDISRITVERALAKLLASEDIIKIGGGRYTKYVWNRERESRDIVN